MPEDEIPEDGQCYMMHCPNYRHEHPLGPDCPGVQEPDLS